MAKDATKQRETATVSGVEYSASGIKLPEAMTFEEWDSLGAQIAVMHNASPWWVGDWYIAGEAAYGEAAAQATAISDKAALHGRQLSPDTVMDYAALCRRFPPPDRSENLSITHYRAVRALPEPRATELLKAAESGEWSVRELKKQIDGDKEPETPERVQMAGDGEYDIILADPPWSYSNSGQNGAAAKHYATMTETAICDFLETEKIKTGPNAVLFLWVTNPLLPAGLAVMEAWGFEYKTNLAWVKETVTHVGGKEKRSIKFGTGFYFRGAHELLLLGVKGKGMLPEVRNVRSVLMAEAMIHSQKPEEVYDAIEAMYPNGRRIELFARHIRYGWDRLGLEAPPA